jgi:anti-sigma factor RsiW
MFGTERSGQRCAALESKLIEYLDGRARPADRRLVEQHLAGCVDCRSRAEDFRALSSALDDLPEIAPSSAFDAALRARVSAEPVRRRFWDWMPTPRLAFAVSALVAMSVWLTSLPNNASNSPVASPVMAESDFGMIRDLPVLENYDVVSKFDALTELPSPAAASPEVVTQKTQE